MYFQLNQVGLSKNVLRALYASSADIPELDQFPKSHIVTFNYYVGLIHFLEENYKEVRSRWASSKPKLTFSRPKKALLKHGLCAKQMLGRIKSELTQFYMPVLS